MVILQSNISQLQSKCCEVTLPLLKTPNIVEVCSKSRLLYPALLKPLGCRGKHLTPQDDGLRIEISLATN